MTRQNPNYHREYYAKNRERIKQSANEYAARVRADPEKSAALRKKRAVYVRKRRVNDPAYAMMYAAKARAVAKGLDFALDGHLPHLRKIVAAGVCELSGLPFSFDEKIRPNRKRSNPDPYAPSLDRIDSAKGYVPDNVRVILTGLNIAMSYWGFDVLETMVNAVRSKRSVL